MQKIANKVRRKKVSLEAIEKTANFKVKSYKVQIKTGKFNSSNVKLPGVKDFWNIGELTVNNKKKNEDPEESNTKKPTERLTGSERYQRYMDEEERIRKIEEEMTDPNLEPHTPDQFERALLKDRNSSLMWIKYMAFHLETAEVDKARAIAKKAIASINFREEQERLNVWIALLNLELRYGTDESYNDVLNEATQRNDSFKVYSQTLKILLDLEKLIDANKIIEILKKKFKPIPDMWLLVSESYLRMNNEKLAKELLPKSLLSLKERDHLDYMTKFALLMSRHNIHDFSQTIFEKILSTYSKNLSIWFTYINMMTKNGEVEIARSLFDRMLVQKFPLKKLKSIFQKYIEFETKHGDNANLSKIKKMAKSMLEKHEEDE
ncbi:rRNA biogenesis protein RRP5-like [Chironomus tepperi]|uniref:rRNA biogenesis protein RRP5-like n=1 Tax=Chironomus tepperi TaxID=113505 RepID=UPI00391EF325